MDMNTLHVETREKWREWLEKYHSTEKNIWLVHYKKHTGKPILPYEDAVEEAICFGWIDSLVRRIDDDTYAQKYTPRNERSTWSETNKQRARNMIEMGKITEAGMQKLGNSLNEISPEPKTSALPKDMKASLKADEQAWKNFLAFAPGYRRSYIEWVVDAKRDDTRARRISVVVERAKKNKKPGVM